MSRPHPRQCHLCPYDGKRSNACLSCNLAEPSHKHQTFVSIDACPQVAAAVPDPEYDDQYKLPQDHSFAVLRQWAKSIGMTELRIKVLLGMLVPGERQSNLARRLGKSKQALGKLLHQMVDDYPVLRPILIGRK